MHGGFEFIDLQHLENIYGLTREILMKNFVLTPYTS